MKIQYQKIENGLEILRIWQDSGIIKVPEQIEGIPVIRIAPYTFSLHKDEEEKNASVYQTETDEEDDRFAQPEELCCGGNCKLKHTAGTCITDHETTDQTDKRSLDKVTECKHNGRDQWINDQYIDLF